MINGERAIFLDVDGVIWSREFRRHHPEARYIDQDPEAMTLVARIAEVANADIVVSSAWRKDNVAETCKLLSRGGAPVALTDRIVGQTPRISKRPRGFEIADYLSEHSEIARYVILDDAPVRQFMGSQIKHLVQTDIKMGLTETDVREAIGILHHVRRT